MAEVETDSLGLRGWLDSVWDSLANSLKDIWANQDITDLPNQPTIEETENLIDSGVAVGKEGFAFFFTFKDFLSALLFFGSPIEIAFTWVSIIAAISGLFLAFGIGRKIAKHVFIFAIALLALFLFFGILGTEIQI